MIFVLESKVTRITILVTFCFSFTHTYIEETRNGLQALPSPLCPLWYEQNQSSREVVKTISERYSKFHGEPSDFDWLNKIVKN